MTLNEKTNDFNDQSKQLEAGIGNGNAVAKLDSQPQDPAQRDSWGGKLDFLMTMIGYAVGLGNVWRYPYLCFKNGGGAFMIPFLIMVVVVGLPMFTLEVALGQFASLGPLSVWRISPMFKGLGYCMVFTCWIVVLYYNVVVTHCAFYLFSSFTSVLPWTSCDNWWNTQKCFCPGCDSANTTLSVDGNSSYSGNAISPAYASNATQQWPNASLMASDRKYTSPSEEYYMNYVLQVSKGIEDMGSLNWQLALCLVFCWVVVIIVLIKGVQSMGKVVYFTALFPYAMLTILLIRGVTLPGATQGILFYLKPNFSRLSDARVWCDAATQIFYSIGACQGGLIAMSSYNKFNAAIYRDAVIVVLLDALTSVFAGCVIFSVLGFMAFEKGVGIEQVVASGPGLAFQVYPEALAKLPISPLWAVFFFLMMCTLGFGSVFSMMECVLCAFGDELRELFRGSKVRSALFRIVLMVISMLLGLPMTTKGGIYLLNLIDNSIGGFPLLVGGLLECVVVQWVYGFDRFAEDVRLMTGTRPNFFWRICWGVLSPLVIFLILVMNIVQYKGITYNKYVYPDWALTLGWFITLGPIALIPLWMLYYFCFKNKAWIIAKESCKPIEAWGPAQRVHKEAFHEMLKTNPKLGKRANSSNGLFQSQTSLVTALHVELTRNKNSRTNLAEISVPSQLNLTNTNEKIDESGFASYNPAEFRVQLGDETSCHL